MSNSSSKGGVLVFLGSIFFFVLFIAGIFLVTSGPVGIQNQWTSWKASAFGSDWYVVHYLPDGGINEYYLKGVAIHNESASDGIYFTVPENGKNVTIHLSTFHEHVQDPTPAVIKGLRGGRKIGYSNVPPDLSEKPLDPASKSTEVPK